MRDYIHVMDLADGHLAALAFLRTNLAWHAINLGTGRGSSVLEMVRAFEASSGQPIAVRIAARRSGDIASCYAKADKALAQLHWQASRSLDEMCASTWRWQCAQTQ